MITNILARYGNKNSNHLWLVFFRCSISALALLNYLALQFDFADIFSTGAFIPPDIASALKSPLFPSIYSIYHNLQSFWGISYESVLITFRILYPLALLMLLAGLFARFSALLSLLLQLILLNSMDFYTYGFDEFTTIALFYCFLFPVGFSYSLDKYFFKKETRTGNFYKYLWLLRAHVGIAYFFSGFEKLLGYNWRNGESIWKMAHAYNMLSFINLDFLYKTPFFLLTGWFIICLEMFYPVFMNLNKSRKYWLAAVISFHVLIAFFMGLYFFSAMMIVLNLTAYYIPFIEKE